MTDYITPPCEREWTPEEREQFLGRCIRGACKYPECENAAMGVCCHCDAPFCSDHGTRGGDRQMENVGAVAVPSQCWLHGGFNADE